jgi:hypothetical protein
MIQAGGKGKNRTNKNPLSSATHVSELYFCLPLSRTHTCTIVLYLLFVCFGFSFDCGGGALPTAATVSLHGHIDGSIVFFQSLLLDVSVTRRNTVGISAHTFVLTW